MNAQEIIEKIQDGIIENKVLNFGLFSDWRDSDHAINTYAVDENGHAIDMSSEDRAEVGKEISDWLLTQQRLEAANNGEQGIEHKDAMDGLKKKLGAV
jgi:hypothetical protein